MVRVWTRLAVMVLACLVMVSMAVAQDQGGGKKRTPQTPEERKAAAEKRFDALEKAAKHDPATGVLTKDEFVAAVKEVNAKMADRAEDMFKNIKKADESKVTKAEYVTFMSEQRRGGKRGGNGGGNGGGDKGT
jgi:Ca2+-binding EF-hand superfamily protein